MRDDVPAALPLLALICGLAATPGLIHPYLVAAALAVCGAGVLARPPGRVLLFAAFGVALATHDLRRVAHERTVAAPFSDRFVTIEAPIDRDWSRRGETQVLRCSSFATEGTQFASGLGIYARFQPPLIERQATVRATGFLRQSPQGFSLTVKSPRLIAYAGRISPWAPSTWNRLAALRLRQYATTYPREVAMVEALVLGRGERLDEESRKSFRRGGTYHLLVFSGMQIALAAAAIALLFRWRGNPRWSDWLLLIFAVSAPLFIGPTASVTRSSLAIGLYAASRILKRPTTFENLWCLAALLDLVRNPTDLTDPAFHLTYAGAGALIFLARPLARWRWAGAAAAAELAIVPLTLFHFHQYALGGSVMTLLLTPLILIMLAAGALFCLTGFVPLLAAIGLLNRACLLLNDAAAPASGFFAAPPTAALVAGLVGALAAIACAHGRRRTAAIAIALAIPTVGAIEVSVRQGNVATPQITFLDVGQGDAILVRSQDHAILVDGGGRSDDARFGESVLLPMLADRGVRRIDVVVLSHAHPDHCGGLPAVVEQFEVGELWLNPRRFRGDCAAALLAAVSKRETPIRLLRGRAELVSGEIEVRATVASRGYRRATENNSSVVLRLTARRRAVLLTGDIEREAELELAPGLHPAVVLKCPHHGSRSSSTPPLLEAVRPRIAVISCGARNWFGHPHPAVLEALARRHVRVFRTDRNGSIDVFLGAHLTVRPEIDTP